MFLKLKGHLISIRPKFFLQVGSHALPSGVAPIKNKLSEEKDLMAADARIKPFQSLKLLVYTAFHETTEYYLLGQQYASLFYMLDWLLLTPLEGCDSEYPLGGRKYSGFCIQESRGNDKMPLHCN